MADFSSAALVGLILRQMGQAGLTVPPELQHAATPGGPPIVAADTKRLLLAEACRQGGPGFLLRIGQGIHAVATDPTLDALRRADEPHGLLQRWLRLERYHHSHHRTLLRSSGERSLHLHHVSLAGPPPAAVEDLVVLGLLAALLQSVGCTGLDVGIAADADAVAVMVEGRIVLGSLPDGVATGQWRIDWQAVGAAMPPRAAAATGRKASLLARFYALLDDDPLGEWTVAAIASRLGQSSRGLQRRLQADGASFSGVIRDARVKRASRLMAGSMVSLAEIGYAAGFSDQAHFTREFRRITGMSPAEWRRVAGNTGVRS